MTDTTAWQAAAQACARAWLIRAAAADNLCVPTLSGAPLGMQFAIIFHHFYMSTRARLRYAPTRRAAALFLTMTLIELLNDGRLQHDGGRVTLTAAGREILEVLDIEEALHR